MSYLLILTKFSTHYIAVNRNGFATAKASSKTQFKLIRNPVFKQYNFPIISMRGNTIIFPAY